MNPIPHKGWGKGGEEFSNNLTEGGINFGLWDIVYTNNTLTHTRG